MDICPTCGRVKKKLKRSDAMNALYWVWLQVICKDLGYTKEELHEVLKAEWMSEFREPEFIEYNGKKIQRHWSTTDLSVGEFTGWLNKVEELAGKLNITLPYPDDIYGHAMGHL